MTGLSRRKYEAQARACTEVFGGMLWHTLALRRPLDRALAAHFRQHRQLGSRDRRFIAETVFAAFRWWGWLRTLAPQAFMQALAQAGKASPALAGPRQASPELTPPQLPHLAWHNLLLGAHLIECESVHPAARVWSAALSAPDEVLDSVPEIDDARDRMRRILELPGRVSTTAEVALHDLLPAWAPGELESAPPLEELVGWLQQRPPVWLRAQTNDVAALLGELREAGLAVEQHPRCTNAFKLGASRINLRTLEAFRSGRFEVQDFASQMVGPVCSPQPGQRWWDACAGGGGKALHLAQLMARKGSVQATDIRTYKLKDLRRRARRAGFPNIRCGQWKGKPLPAKRATFHGVLVDAPCSGSGTWRRNPDGRWRVGHDEIDELCALQRRLLANAATGVRPKGVLVYATCSMFARENRAVVEGFLAENPDFELFPFASPVDGQPTDGMLQIWPADADCDAMFVAKMRKASVVSGP